MLKETIKYTDYNGEEREEDFYFNLSRAEIIDMDYSIEGGLRQLLERIVQTKDTVQIYKMFTNIIFKAYGEKSPDGKRFIKSTELSESFIQTEAYSELIMHILSDPEYAAKFVNAIVPKDVSDKANEIKV